MEVEEGDYDGEEDDGLEAEEEEEEEEEEVSLSPLYISSLHYCILTPCWLFVTPFGCLWLHCFRSFGEKGQWRDARNCLQD